MTHDDRNHPDPALLRALVSDEKLPPSGDRASADSMAHAVVGRRASATGCSSTGFTRKRLWKSAVPFGSFFDSRVGALVR